jgi:hypothetical protein
MKYAINHPWKFESWATAFWIGFFQMGAVVSVELVNLAVLITNETLKSTIMNFLALVIISEFDDYLFVTVKRDPLSRLIVKGEIEWFSGQIRTLEEITLIETTSSGDARFPINTLKDGQPSPNAEYF